MKYLKENDNWIDQYNIWVKQRRGDKLRPKEEVEIHFPKLSDNKINSFWYCGESEIASVKLNDNSKLIAFPTGEIRVQFEVDGPYYRNENAVIEANNIGLTDNDLERIYGDDGFGASNWFEIERRNDDNEILEDEFEICDTYDEAITSLINLRNMINEDL